jgi:hypothetical protein
VNRMRFVVLLIGLGLMIAPLAGCKELLAALPRVVAVVPDAMLIVDQVESFTGNYFKAHPNPKKEAEVSKAISRARSSLIVAQRSAVGGDKAANGQTLSAIADFKVAYEELLKACEGIAGFSVGDASQSFAAAGDALVVPTPLALEKTLQLEE